MIEDAIMFLLIELREQKKLKQEDLRAIMNLITERLKVRVVEKNNTAYNKVVKKVTTNYNGVNLK